MVGLVSLGFGLRVLNLGKGCRFAMWSQFAIGRISAIGAIILLDEGVKQL